MSEPIKQVRFKSPRFLSVPARLANRRNLVTPLQVAEEAARDIKNSVRRNLEDCYSSSESSDVREQNVNANIKKHRSVSRVTFRRNYSPEPIDLSLFEPNPERNMDNIQPEAVDREIERLRAHTGQEIAANYEDAGQPAEGTSNALLAELVHSIREIQGEMRDLREQMHDLRVNREISNETQMTTNNVPYDVTYGRTERDIRNRRSTASRYLTLKDAILLIPEFDGSSRQRLQEFLNASTYAIQIIDPADEEALIQAILYTKLKGKAMQDFETRNIQTFEDLKIQLETCYQAKQSTTHLQIEFNSIKQRPNETALAFGQRVDKLAMRLYESMVEGERRPPIFKHVIQETVKRTALINFQIGLRDELQVLVRSQRYNTLQEAINGATAEEKLIKPSSTRASGYSNKNKDEAKYTRSTREINIQCYKCGKSGHYGRDCRSNNKYALPKPEKSTRVNTASKFCNYCKKSGHSRDECWNANGQPKKYNKHEKQNAKSNYTESTRELKNSHRQRKKSTDSASSDEEEKKEAKKKQTRPALEYRVTHIKNKRAPAKDELLQITLPIREVKNGKIDMLYDSGSTISLIKLKNLKDNALIQEEKIALTGISGHKIYTIGKMYATIEINKNKIKHAFYIIQDDVAIEHNGILGIDFLKKQTAICDYAQNQITLKNNILKLHPCNKITLKPRSETIIRAATNQNRIGIVRAEEPVPGVYIGNCLVDTKNFLCPVSIINTTDNEIKIPTPIVTLEDVEKDTQNINTVRIGEKVGITTPREQQI